MINQKHAMHVEGGSPLRHTGKTDCFEVICPVNHLFGGTGTLGL